MALRREDLSSFERFSLLPARWRIRILRKRTDDELARLRYDWTGWRARPKQMLPAQAFVAWLILTGRGWGKTRTGAETVRIWKEDSPRIALVGRTVPDARDVMVNGESGILATAPPWDRPLYTPSQRKIEWANGSVAYTYSADEPSMLRGPQFHKAWADELASWRYEEAWSNLLLTLRLGEDPQVIVTTTPKPRKFIVELMNEPTTFVTSGTSYENTQNLAPTFLSQVVRRYEGTRLGQQELHGQLLTNVVGALWTREMLERSRVKDVPVALVRIVVAIDPQAAAPSKDREIEEEQAETGIVVAGLGTDGHGYVLADLTIRGTPHEWAKQAIDAYNEYTADRIVAEVNNGGAMVGYTIGTVDGRVPFSEVWASRGKYTRAEPVSALYERRYVHNVGYFAELEDQCCTWVPGDKSPDRMDALVWAISELFFPQPTGETEVVTEERGMEHIGPSM